MGKAYRELTLKTGKIMIGSGTPAVDSAVLGIEDEGGLYLGVGRDQNSSKIRS